MEPILIYFVIPFAVLVYCYRSFLPHQVPQGKEVGKMIGMGCGSSIGIFIFTVIIAVIFEGDQRLFGGLLTGALYVGVFYGLLRFGLKIPRFICGRMAQWLAIVLIPAFTILYMINPAGVLSN